MSISSEVGWDQPIVDEINAAVKIEVGKIRVAQKVFPTKSDFVTEPTEIPNDVITFPELSIAEGITKPLVRLHREFPLTDTQRINESKNNTCLTLARMAAKSIAIAEDTVIFQGKNAKKLLDSAKIMADHLDKTNNGLLGEVPKANHIDVDKPKNPKPGVLYGENVFAKAAEGIAKLTSEAQAPPFALFLPTRVYADTFVPPSEASLVTTAERIKPLVEAGFHGTGALPDNQGLLVASGGNPTVLYLGSEAKMDFVRKEGTNFIFHVVERIQFVARDPRALVLLNFK